MRTLALTIAAACLLGACATDKKATTPTEGAVTREGIILGSTETAVSVYTPTAEQDQVFQLRRAETATITRQGQQISWAEVAPGTPVRVALEPNVGAEVPTRVEVLTGSEAQQVLSQVEQNPPPRIGAGAFGQPQRPAPQQPGMQQPQMPEENDGFGGDQQMDEGIE